MYSRMALALSALFWLTMNFLLWRSEFGASGRAGGAVPTELVWRKILTAPDNSSLDILHHGKKQGYCRWTTTGGRNPAIESADDMPLQTQPRKPTGYRLNLEGNLTAGKQTNRIQFNFDLKLATNRVWQEVDFRFAVHEGSVAAHSVAAEKNVRLRTESDGQRDEQTLTFAQLQNPASLMQAFELPVPLALLELPNLVTNAPKESLPGLGLVWQARNDWINIGHASVRVYRLETRVLDRYQATIFVSPVGEILRVELPDDWLLVNDEAGGL